MPSSFESFQEEIRPRTLIDGPPRRARRSVVQLAVAAVRALLARPPRRERAGTPRPMDTLPVETARQMGG